VRKKGRSAAAADPGAGAAGLSAERRGEEVKLQFTVPSVNTDGTRPANVERLDIFRFTGPPTATDNVLKLGTKVASVPVKHRRTPTLRPKPTSRRRNRN
jgi:hypothetical protein